MSLTKDHRKELEELMEGALQGHLDAQQETRLRAILTTYNPGAADLPRDYLIRSGTIQLGADILLEMLFPETPA